MKKFFNWIFKKVLLRMYYLFFSPDPFAGHWTPQEWATYIGDIAYKLFISLLRPMVFATAMLALRRYVFVAHQWQIHDRGVDLLIFGLVQGIIGIIYAVLLGLTLNTVWPEYKMIRVAVRTRDLKTFVLYCDENVPPLMHLCMGTLASFLIICFMIVDCGNVFAGYFCVAVSGFVTSMAFFVIHELDRPFSGLWVISGIDPEWFKINPRQWRMEYFKASVETKTEAVTADGTQTKTTHTETVEASTAEPVRKS